MHTNSTILIVDDSEGSREIMGALLESQGYNLLFATNGIEALEQATHHMPDLILLDVMMPGMDGFTVCQRLRSNPHTAEVPIILVTALDDRTSRLQGIEVGADEFLTKPIDRIELATRVRTITRINRYRLLLEERHRVEEHMRRAAHELETAYDTTLMGWARALDLRDKETEGHSQRVTRMTVRLAQALGVPEADIVQMRRGALLHDIGKLGIPDAILQKPGPLDEDEWVIMRKHPLYAYDMLAPIPFLGTALDIPYYHHEKWDGSGYPCGLAGEDIPLAARIFAVVDVWDALTNDRPYRAAWTPERALNHIQSLVGTHFDPQVVAAFVEKKVWQASAPTSTDTMMMVSEDAVQQL
jgi:putative two-component system response regulator